MKKQKSIKSLMVPLIMFMVGFGLITGCSNKKSDNMGNSMDSTGTGMSSQGMNNNMNSANMMTFTATLSGDNEVPAVNTDASGQVTVTMMNNDSVHVEGQFSDLSSAYTASHIHMAAKGKNGNVIQPLDPQMDNDNMSGSWDTTYVMDQSQIQALKGGQLYVNVHSKNNKNGEIRGQLMSSDNSNMNNDDSY